MRKNFFFLLLPVFGKAQFKRSATALAKENIQTYLTQKIFKDQPYQPVSFGELNVLKKMIRLLHGLLYINL